MAKLNIFAMNSLYLGFWVRSTCLCSTHDCQARVKGLTDPHEAKVVIFWPHTEGLTSRREVEAMIMRWRTRLTPRSSILEFSDTHLISRLALGSQGLDLSSSWRRVHLILGYQTQELSSLHLRTHPILGSQAHELTNSCRRTQLTPIGYANPWG